MTNNGSLIETLQSHGEGEEEKTVLTEAEKKIKLIYDQAVGRAANAADLKIGGVSIPRRLISQNSDKPNNGFSLGD